MGVSLPLQHTPASEHAFYLDKTITGPWVPTACIMVFLLRLVLLISHGSLTSNFIFFSSHVYYNYTGEYRKLKSLLETIHGNTDLNPVLRSFHYSLPPSSLVSNDIITG